MGESRLRRMSVALHAAEESDLDQVVGLMRGLYDQDGTPFDPSEARDALLGLLRDASLGRIWLIRSGNDTVGYAVLTLGYSLEFLGKDAFVDELYLLPEYRGKGLGKLAMAFLEEQCRALRVRALHLEVSRDNQAALGLYRRFGFEERGYSLMTRRIEP
jgi:ribosomal protein S18 acetylase RimI-like enzyme